MATVHRVGRLPRLHGQWSRDWCRLGALLFAAGPTNRLLVTLVFQGTDGRGDSHWAGRLRFGFGFGRQDVGQQILGDGRSSRGRDGPQDPLSR
jgi:hypothetical protein